MVTEDLDLQLLLQTNCSVNCCIECTEVTLQTERVQVCSEREIVSLY